MKRFEELTEKIRGILNSEHRTIDRMQGIVDMLQMNVVGYDCVAIFVVDPENTRQLIMGTQAGPGLEPGDAILIGQGICGQVAERGISMVVDDVSQELNYVMGHEDTKSEIALPIFRGSHVVSVLDINAFALSQFEADDRLFLEEICMMLTDQV